MTRAEVQPNDVVAGRYQLEALIGTGGMATIYRATDLTTATSVAIKLLHPGHAVKARRFEREVRVAARLHHHPNVVKVHASGEDVGSFYIVMELLTGPTLRRVLNNDRANLPVPRALEIAIQMAEVLTAAHEIALVHRDLKPENVILEPTADGRERVVVIDFGIAFVLDAELDGRITTADNVCGTPRYYSPEQARAEEIEPPSDIYSFGCVLFENGDRRATLHQPRPGGTDQLAPVPAGPVHEHSRPQALERIRRVDRADAPQTPTPTPSSRGGS